MNAIFGYLLDLLMPSLFTVLLLGYLVLFFLIGNRSGNLKQRIFNAIVVADQTAHSIITFGDSYPDETMSSAAWRMEKEGRFFGFTRPLIDKIFSFWEQDHCKSSYFSEVRRFQAPPEI